MYFRLGTEKYLGFKIRIALIIKQLCITIHQDGFSNYTFLVIIFDIRCVILYRYQGTEGSHFTKRIPVN